MKEWLISYLLRWRIQPANSLSVNNYLMWIK